MSSIFAAARSPGIISSEILLVGFGFLLRFVRFIVFVICVNRRELVVVHLRLGDLGRSVDFRGGSEEHGQCEGEFHS